MVEKIKKLIKQFESSKGGINLFMLWKDNLEVEKWSIVISSAWSDKVALRTALDYWIEQLQSNLTSAELQSIGRVSFLKTNDNFVKDLARSINVTGGPTRITKSKVGSYEILDAIIFEAKNLIPIAAPASSNRNPLINGSINPNINGSINPNINGSINPNINGSINPNINGSINPNINGSINPNINGSINPNINGSINPNINGSINPNINGSINPNINSNFDGFYLYDLSFNKNAYFIEVNDKILLMFDMNSNYVGFGVKSSNKNFYTIFSARNNEWLGYCVSNKKGGYNYFSTNGQWLGFLV